MRNKSRGSLYLFLLIFMLLTGVWSDTALAKDNGNDYLNAEIKTEISEDEASADVTVIIKNTGVEPVHDIQVEGVIQDGLNLAVGSTSQKEIGTLVPGSESAIQFEVYAKSQSSQIPSENPDSDDQNNDNITDQNPENVDSENNEDKSNTLISDTKDEQNNDKSSVDTGDSSHTFIYLFICIAALFVIVAVCIKTKKGKRILSILICISLITPALLNVKEVNASESGDGSFSVENTVRLNGKDYKLTADINYRNTETVLPSGDTLTRAQWIDELLTAIGYDGQEAVYDNTAYPFTDISGHEFQNEILIAYGNSILPDMETEFSPNSPATREFAAVTAVKALGFVPEMEIACNDADAITYKKEIETSVAMDIFRLDNNMFYPARELTRSEADTAIQVINEIINTQETEGNTGQIYYDKDVLIIPDYASYEISENTVIFTSGGENITEGTIFVMPDQTPYKAVSVQETNDQYVVETEVPLLEETLIGMTAQGTATVDATQFIPAEGVTMTSANTASARNARIDLVDVEGSYTGPGKLDFKVHKKIGAGELSAAASISLPQIMYKADIDLGWGGVNVKNVYLKFPAELQVEGSYTISNDADITVTGGIIELGKIPVAGIPGVTVYVQISLEYDINGKLQVKYTLDGTSGVQVINNRLRMIKDLKSDLEVPSLGGEIKWGGGISGLLEVCNTWDLIDFGLSAGAAAKGELIVRNPELLCLDADMYIYGEISALDDGVIGDWLEIGYKWEFWNSENSPLKCNWHWENFERVNECTYHPEDENVMEFNGHKYKFYNDSMTWAEAKAFCEEQGGHLVTITSEEEQIAVYQYIEEFGIDADIWIGLSDAEEEGNWSHWITGEEVSYTNWGSGEPDDLLDKGDGQDYGVICSGYRSGSGYYIEPGQWDDIAVNGETASGFFVCEWES